MFKFLEINKNKVRVGVGKLVAVVCSVIAMSHKPRPVNKHKNQNKGSMYEQRMSVADLPHKKKGVSIVIENIG